MQTSIDFLPMPDERAAGAFNDYLNENWHVYQAFEREALKVFRTGRDYYSARTILHHLRFMSVIAEHGSEWKINNNHSPYFARLFELRNPECEGFFRMRVSKADSINSSAESLSA